MPVFDRERVLWYHETERMLRTVEGYASGAAGQPHRWFQSMGRHYREQWARQQAKAPTLPKPVLKFYRERFEAAFQLTEWTPEVGSK